MGGLGHRRTEAQWGRQGTVTSAGRLATHTTCPSLLPEGASEFPAAMGLVIGLRSGKEKINSLCRTNCCPFPQALTILALFPGKQMMERLVAVLFALRGSLKKEPPRAGGWGKGASCELGGEAGRRVTRGGHPSEAGLEQAPSLGWGHLPGKLEDGAPSRTAWQQALRMG